MQLRFKPGFDWQRVTWGRPDSVPTAICSYCHGGLPEVPLMLWREDGSAASFCDECLEEWVISEARNLSDVAPDVAQASDAK